MALSASAGRTPGLTRRTVLTGAAAFLAAGAADALAPLPAGAAAAPLILAAAAGWTGRDGELLVLTADPDTETDHAVRILAEPADADEPAVPGPPLPLPLPADFRPHSMAAIGPVLWITGAVELGPDRSRPALLRIEDGAAAETALPVPEEIRSGIATAVTPVGTDGLAVAIEGCPDEHLAVLSRSHLALSLDRGATWTERALATGLGEGYGTVLTETDRGVFASVADATGTQTLHTGVLEESGLRLETVATLPESGRPMAAVACDRHVSVFSEHDGTAVEARFTHDGAPLEAAGRPDHDCGCDGEILAVPGRRGLWLETDGAAVHIRGAR